MTYSTCQEVIIEEFVGDKWMCLLMLWIILYTPVTIILLTDWIMSNVELVNDTLMTTSPVRNYPDEYGHCSNETAGVSIISDSLEKHRWTIKFESGRIWIVQSMKHWNIKRKPLQEKCAIICYNILVVCSDICFEDWHLH